MLKFLKASKAIDDLSDIIKDLLEVQWYLKNDNVEGGLWHFSHLMKTHTEHHMVDLLKYLAS